MDASIKQDAGIVPERDYHERHVASPKDWSPDQLREKLLTVICAGANPRKSRQRPRPSEVGLCENFFQPIRSELKRKRSIIGRDESRLKQALDEKKQEHEIKELDEKKHDDDDKRHDDDNRRTSTSSPSPPLTLATTTTSSPVAVATQTTMATSTQAVVATQTTSVGSTIISTSREAQTPPTSLSIQPSTTAVSQPITTSMEAPPLASVSSIQTSSTSIASVLVVSTQPAVSTEAAVSTSPMFASLTAIQTTTEMQSQISVPTTIQTSTISSSSGLSSVSAVPETIPSAAPARTNVGGGRLSWLAIVAISFSISLVVVLVIGTLMYRKRKLLFARYGIYRAKRRGSTGNSMSISNPILRPLTANDKLSQEYAQMTFAPKEKDALFAPRPRRRTQTRIRELLAAPLSPFKRFSRATTSQRESSWANTQPNTPAIPSRFSTNTESDRTISQISIKPPLPARLKSYISTTSSYKSEVPIGYDGDSTPRLPRESRDLYPPSLFYRPGGSNTDVEPYASNEKTRLSEFQFNISNDTISTDAIRRQQEQLGWYQDSNRASKASFGTSNFYPGEANSR